MPSLSCDDCRYFAIPPAAKNDFNGETSCWNVITSISHCHTHVSIGKLRSSAPAAIAFHELKAAERTRLIAASVSSLRGSMPFGVNTNEYCLPLLWRDSFQCVGNGNDGVARLGGCVYVRLPLWFWSVENNMPVGLSCIFLNRLNWQVIE